MGNWNTGGGGGRGGSGADVDRAMGVDRSENDNPFGSTSGRSIGSSNAKVGGSERGDNEKVDRVAYTNPDTGLVNTRNFNTGEKYTKGFDRVNVGGKTIAVSPSAAKSVSRGEGGDTPLTRAISSRQSTSPVQSGSQAVRSSVSPVSTSAIASGYYGPEAFNAVRGPIGVAGVLSDLSPYGDFRVTPTAMTPLDIGSSTGFPSPVDLRKAYFDDGTQTRYFSPGESGLARLSFYDEPPTPDSEESFIEKVVSRFNDKFTDVDQALVGYEVDEYGNLTATTDPMRKTSDNAFGDFLGNALAGAMGISPFTGVLDTQQYQPYFGEKPKSYQYSTASGGLLSDYIGDKLIPQSEIDERNRARRDESNESNEQGRPLVIPDEAAAVDSVTGEPTAFPKFTPRKYEYSPFVANFYSIPARFTQPNGLLA